MSLKYQWRNKCSGRVVYSLCDLLLHWLHFDCFSLHLNLVIQERVQAALCLGPEQLIAWAEDHAVEVRSCVQGLASFILTWTGLSRCWNGDWARNWRVWFCLRVCLCWVVVVIIWDLVDDRLRRALWNRIWLKIEYRLSIMLKHHRLLRHGIKGRFS